MARKQQIAEERAVVRAPNQDNAAEDTEEDNTRNGKNDHPFPRKPFQFFFIIDPMQPLKLS